MSAFVEDFMAQVIARNPSETEFHQAVQEVVESLEVVLDPHIQMSTRMGISRDR